MTDNETRLRKSFSEVYLATDLSFLSESDCSCTDNPRLMNYIGMDAGIGPS
jgi:hypothetical protein